jgi:hypothetical protein
MNTYRVHVPSANLIHCRRDYISSDNWGQRTYMTKYHTVSDGLILQRAEELQVECFDSEEILAKLADEENVSDGTGCIDLG